MPIEEVTMTQKEITAKVDLAGDLEKQIELMTNQLETLKDKLKDEAGRKVSDGAAVVLEGNVFKATVPFSATFNDLGGIETELDPIDNDQGDKLVPWKGKKSHKEFVGNQGDIKEIKLILDDYEGGDELYKRAFKHIPNAQKRTPDKTGLGNMARTDVKKHEDIKAIVLKFIKAWTPKSIAFVRKEST